MAWLLTIALLAAAQTPDTVPVPPGHRRFGPPLRSEIIPGWETFIGDVPRSATCVSIDLPMVRPLNPPQRAVGVAMLSSASFRRISDREAARLIGIAHRRGQPLAVTVFEGDLDEMRQRRHRAMVERRDSWSVADQRDFDALTARLATGEPRRYRPYLVRGVSKFGDGGAPMMFGQMCGDELQLLTLTFSYTIPPSERVPAVVFMLRPPQRVIASVQVAW